MEKSKLHKDFKLNGVTYVNAKELIAAAQKLPILGIADFLKDWFSNEAFIYANTSGSTGVPKKIKLEKGHMMHSALATGTYFNLPNKTSALLCLPVAYIAGKMMLVRALTLGWHLDVITSTLKPLEGTNKEYNFAAMIPLQLEKSLSKINRIKKVIVGGGVVSASLQDQLQNLQTKVFATYGMTETVTHIAVKKLNHLHICPSYYQLLPNVTSYIDHRNCLVIKAPKVTHEVVFTNDVVRLISDTEFAWLGRFDNVINSGGVKLHPEKIEEKLAQLIQNRFFVIGIKDEQLGEKLVVLIEEKEESKQVVLKNNLLAKIKESLLFTKFEIPKEVFTLDKFIETETGKVKRYQTVKSLLNK